VVGTEEARHYHDLTELDGEPTRRATPHISLERADVAGITPLHGVLAVAVVTVALVLIRKHHLVTKRFPAALPADTTV
jgi:hypothetical protein